MSAVELISEKARGLSESEAQFVLKCIDAVRGPSPKPSDLLKMPREVRKHIIAAQCAKAEHLYRDNPELIMEDKEGPMDYE